MTSLPASTKTVTTLKQSDRYYRTPDNRIGLGIEFTRDMVTQMDFQTSRVSNLVPGKSHVRLRFDDGTEASFETLELTRINEDEMAKLSETDKKLSFFNEIAEQLHITGLTAKGSSPETVRDVIKAICFEHVPDHMDRNRFLAYRRALQDILRIRNMTGGDALRMKKRVQQSLEREYWGISREVTDQHIKDLD